MARMQRIVQFIRRGAERLADEAHPIDAGVVLRSPSLSRVYGINQLRIARPTRFEDVLELAERHLGTLPFRHVVIEDDATGARLEEPFRAAGWKLERDLLMALRRDTDRAVDTNAVIEPGEEPIIAMMIRWHLEADPDAAATVVSQLAEYSRREGRVWEERGLAIPSPSGQLAAITKLRSDGHTAQVEDVYTLPEARGRGYARTLVSHAVALARAAGHDLIFIVADDQNWPQQLYSRLGFEPVGRMRSFHLDLGSAA